MEWFFKALDDDGDTYLSETEWELGEEAFSETYSKTFDEVDTDDDDQISLEEFETLMGVSSDSAS